MLAGEARSGSVLIKQGAAVPETVERSSEQFVPGWNLVKDADADETEKALEQANWRFFYAKPEIEASAYARDLNRAIKKAVRRLTRKVERGKLNAVQIVSVLVTKIFGLYHVTVQGYARHIQQSPLPPRSHLKEGSPLVDRSQKGRDTRAA